MILQTYRFLWVFSFIEIFHVNMTSNEFCKCSLGYVYLRHFGCPMTTIDTSQTIDGNVRSAFVIVVVCYYFISVIFSPHFDHACLQWTGSPNSSKNRAHCLPINTEDGPFDPIKCQDNNNRKFWNSQRQSAIFRSIYQKIIMRAAQQLMLISISVWITISQSIDIIGHGKLNYRTTNTQIVCV